MKKIQRTICFFLCVTLCIGILPLQAFAKVDPPVAPHDGLILEFENATTMTSFLLRNGGDPLGGNMLLVDGSYNDALYYDEMPDVVSVTYNYTVETAALADQYGYGRDTSRDDPELKSENLAFWHALAVIADGYGENALHTTRVAVMDTGIDGTHEELAGRVVAGYDAVEDTVIAAGVNSEQSADSHGTMVAGLIAAQALNGKGIAGTAGAFPVELVPVRVLNENGKGKIADIVRGIYWAIENDIDILNMSFGARMEYYPTALANAIRDARAQNIFPIAAAGNEYGRTWEGYYPACLEGCYPVMSGTEGIVGDYSSAFSNTFPQGAVPGKDYTSINGADVKATAMGGLYADFTGTSASCALISGYAAAMFSLLGGRTNAGAIETVTDVFTHAHTINTNLNRYTVILSELDDAVSTYITADAIENTRQSIQGALVCDDALSGDEQIGAKLLFGESYVADATLIVFDANDELVYTSEPIVNNGENKTTYTFELDTTLLEDGDITLGVYFRTAEELQTAVEPQSAKHAAKATSRVNNNLAYDKATVVLKDADGAQFSAPVYVTKDDNLIAILESDKGEAITVNRYLFEDDSLTFTCMTSGIVYQKTSAFASEIILGGDEVQSTKLSFADDAVTLSGATVYAQAPNGTYVSLGNTDERGEITLQLSDVSMPLITIDNEKRYVLCVNLTQDGNQTAISFADDINSANEVTVSSVAGLSDEDRYVLIVSANAFGNAINGVSTRLFAKSENTVHVSGTSLYAMVAIYDVMYLSSAPEKTSYYKFYYTAHILGETDFSAISEIDFDLTTVYTKVSLTDDSLVYGKSTEYTATALDSDGNVLIGGHYLDYASIQNPVNCATWYGSQDLWLRDAELNDHSWLIDRAQNKIMTTTDYGMALPAVNGVYTFTAKCYIDTYYIAEYEGYTGILSYEGAEASAEFSVELGATFGVSVAPLGDGFVNLDPRMIRVIKDGKVSSAVLLSQDQTYLLDATEFDEDTKLFFWLSVYYNEPTALGVTNYCCPVLVSYDADHPTVVLELPDTDFGVLNVKLGENTVYDMTMTVSAGGAELGVRAYSNAAYPVGNYGISFVANDANGAYVLCYESVTLQADTATNVLVDTESYTQITVDKTGMTDVVVYPIIDGKIQKWSDSYYGSLYEPSSKLLISPSLDGLGASVSMRDYQYMGGNSYLVEIPLTADSVMLDAMSMQILSFDASPQKPEFTEDEDVVLNLEAYLTGDFRLIGLKQALMSGGGKEPVGVELFPELHYRVAEGKWQTCALPDWTGISLGKLDAGVYEAVISFQNGTAGVGMWESSFAFVVSEGAGAENNVILLNAPSTAKEELQLTVTGVPGASVTLSYTAPSGAKTVLDTITIPENGTYRFHISLNEEGEYVFEAVSELDGEEDAEATPITVENTYATPAAITGFSVVSLADGSLKLTWNKPSDAVKVYVFRDSTALGYLPANVTEFTDSIADLNASRLYTYTLIAENEAGTRGQPAYAQGKPSLVEDTQAPTAPATLNAQAKGMSVTLSWTKSTDNIGIVGYRVYRDGVLIKDSVKRTFTDEGLEKGTEYTYYVTAYDSAGNESAPCASVSAKTAENYSIDSLTVKMDTNRLGNITDDRMSVIVSAGTVDQVLVRIVYVTEQGEDREHELALGKSGAFWMGTWAFTEVREIVSVTVYAYKNGALAAEKAAEGYPRSVSSRIALALRVNNAAYAQNALANISLVLKDIERDLSFRRSLQQNGELSQYAFERLSAGTYRLTVEYMAEGETHILSQTDNIVLGVGDQLDLGEIRLDNFVRIRQEYPFMLYGVSIYDSLTDDGYLKHGDDSAIFVPTGVDSITLITPWTSTTLYLYDNFYSIARTYRIELLPDVYEYEVDALNGVAPMAARLYCFRFTAGEDVSLQGLPVRFSWGSAPVICYPDQNGECELALPEIVSALEISIEETLLSDSTVVMAYSKTVWLEQESFPYECNLKTEARQTVRLQFSSDADLDGLKMSLIGASDIIKLALDESGYAELSLDMQKQAPLRALIERTFAGDRLIPAQSVDLIYDEQSGIYHATVRSEQAIPLALNLKFEDAEGFSVEGARVELTSRFETKEIVLGADGTLLTTLCCSSAEDRIIVAFSGKNGNLEWSSQRFAVSPSEDEHVLTVHSKLLIPIEGDPYAFRYELFYSDGEQIKWKTVSHENNLLTVDPSLWANADGEVLLVAVPLASAWKKDYLSEYDAEERLAFWQTCDNVCFFALNGDAEPIVLNTPELYTVTSVKDLTGEPQGQAAGYVYIGDRLLYGFDVRPGTKIPVISSEQRVVITIGMNAFLTEDELTASRESYRGTFCVEYELLPTLSHEIDVLFGYQKTYHFELKDKQGNAYPEIQNYFVWFDKATRRYVGSSSYLQSNECRIDVNATSGYVVFAGWIADCDSTLLNMYSFWDEMGENVARFDLDPTVTEQNTITLSAIYEPIYRLSRIMGFLDTDIKSITPQANGSYLVRLAQNSVRGYESAVSLPEGAYDILVNGADYGNSTEVLMPDGEQTYDITFSISKQDLTDDPLLECYIVTPYGKNLQFVRELSYDVFSYGMRPTLSSNEVRFVPVSKKNRTIYETYDAYNLSVFDLSTTYGATFGYDRVHIGYTGINQVAQYLYEDVLDPESAHYRADYTTEDYKGYAYSEDRGIYRVYEGRWITFTAGTDDFALALNVDGIPLVLNDEPPYPMVSGSIGGSFGNYYLLANGNILPAGYRMPTVGANVDCSFQNTYDEENGVYWLTSEFLADYGFYDPQTGQGMIYVPMAEPDAYPHVYDIDLLFRYYGADGEQKTLSYDESMTIYFDAPVLQKWNFEHYGRDEVQASPYYYVTVTNKADRDGFRSAKSKHMTLDWNGTDIFTFNAWFDRPEEIAHVYAVADVPDFCENAYFELFYDAELGYFTGTGLLGDALNPPKNYNIVYELAAEQPYGDMPTVQLMDLIKNIVTDEQAQNTQNALPDGWTLEEAAPGNGWTLQETYEKWAAVETLLTELAEAKKTLSEQDLLPILGEELRLYLPAYNLYDEKGELVITFQNYYNLSGEREASDYSFDLALMNRTELYATLTTGVSIDEEQAMISYVTGSDNLSLILPDFDVETVESAGIAAVLGMLKPLASNAGAVIGSKLSAAGSALVNAGAKAIGVGKNLAASGKLTQGADFVSNAFLVRNTFLSAETLDSMKNIANQSPSTEWMNYLTPQQHREYMRYQAVANGHNLVGGAFSLFPGATIPGIILTVYTDILYGVTDIESKYKKMAEINKQMLEDQKRMVEYMRSQELGYDFEYHIDPSGYVFEGTEDNLLEGVTATVYYLDGNEWVKWNSEAYGEGPNPNITDSQGKYGWDVLVGKWKVVFEKDGYYSVESIELDVPPAHLDVNMSMVSKSPAQLVSVDASASGEYIEFTFDRPVLVSDVCAKVRVLFCGETVDGTIVAQNEALTAFGNKQAAGAHDVIVGQRVATVFRFIPDEPMDIGTSVVLTGEQGILTYNGLECEAFESDYVEISEAVADTNASLYYEGAENLQIGDELDLNTKLEITGGEGAPAFKSLNPEIADVTEGGIVTAKAGGMAYILITLGEAKTVAAICVNDEQHVHSFDVQSPLMQYLASDATCTSGATYYYACECGEKGNEAYEYGEADATAHTGTVEWQKTATHHQKTYTCCGATVVAESVHTSPKGVCTVCGDIVFIYGDADGDGKINGKDATRLLQYLANYDPATGESTLEVKLGADCNGDGKINGKDATRLLQYLASFDPETGESTITLGP